MSPQLVRREDTRPFALPVRERAGSSEAPSQWWIERGDGSGQRLAGASVLIGRSPDCEVILLDQRASAYHSVLVLGPDGPRLVTLGRLPPLVDGVPAERVHPLAAGATVEFPGEVLRLRARGPEATPALTWAVERPSGVVIRPTGRTVTIGGGDDDIVIPGWAPAALTCHAVQGGVVAVPSVSVVVRGEWWKPPAMVPLTAGDRVVCGGEGFTFVVLTPDETAATVAPLEAPFATRVRFEFLPTGGTLRIEFPDVEATLRLSELRALLVAALLGAHRAYPVGAPIPDDDLVRLIWPSQLSRTNLHLNQVVHRLREALLAAGIDPLRVIARDRAGPATSFRVGPNTRVEVA